jgi:dolichyl-diphosphooligosaccharide--protein glycosyltransferase
MFLGIFYAYMVAVWGGFIFVLNMIGLHAGFLLVLNEITFNYSTTLYRG